MARQITQEELQNFIDNPDQVDANDLDLINALASAELRAAGDTGGEAEVIVDPDAKALEDAKAVAGAKIAEDQAQEKAAADAEAAKKVADATAGKTAGEDEEGAGKEGAKILAPDGKSTLPYSVLKGARERAQGAEAALAEAQQTIVALSDRMKAIEAGQGDPGGEAKSADELEAMVDAVREDAPWLADKIAPLIKAVRSATEKIEDYEQQARESDDEVRARLQRVANESLANNPVLVLWKEEAPELYNEAVTFDRSLRGDPRFKTFDARFDHAVRLVKANHEGENIPLPTPVTSKQPATTQPSAADLKARAAKALAEAEDTTVRTLTDIPGGEGEVTTHEQLERMDVHEIADKLGRMAPQDLISWVSSGSRL
jgi:hypothetical protein